MFSKPSDHSLNRSEARRDVDGLALSEGYNRLLHVRPLAAGAAEHLHFALGDERVDALHLDIEQLLNRFLDLRLRRIPANLEDDLVLIGQGRGLLGDDRAHDYIVMARVQAHLKRASSASTAAFVRTSFSRRRMS